MTHGSNDLHFWYDAQNRPAIVAYNGTKYAYIYNLQGDVLGLIDSNGTEVVKYTYDAWGKVLSTTGSLAPTLGIVQPFRYRGYVYDVETELYYLRSRYYNTEWDRFINADIIIRGNLFAYCKANPVAYSDQNGTRPFPSPTPGPVVPIVPGPTVPERDTILSQVNNVDIPTPFEQARDTYNSLYPGRSLFRIMTKSSSEPTSFFKSSTHTYNWAARVAYDVAQAATDISGEIGSFVDTAFEAYGIPFQPGPYIDNGIQIVSGLILPDTPPETHQYTIYHLKDAYNHSVNGYRYVSIEQEFYSCELTNCTIHNSGAINVTITVSNDVFPFYFGTRQSVTIHYNMSN